MEKNFYEKRWKRTMKETKKIEIYNIKIFFCFSHRQSLGLKFVNVFPIVWVSIYNQQHISWW